jgi:glycosyltransferase involved in cell wall biosynthesis
MSSIPFAAPWNGADKNLGRLIARMDTENEYILQTGIEDDWPAHVTPIRSKYARAMPTSGQKIRTFGYLLANSRRAEIVHLIASFSNPSRLATGFLDGWKKASGKPVIHTFPSLGDLQLSPENFIADVNVVVSDASRKKLEALGVGNIVRIIPPIHADLLRPKQNPEQLNRSLSLGPRAILYPGHYGVDSGIKQVIQAFAALPAAFNDCVLVLACRTHSFQDAKLETARVRKYAKDAGVSERMRVLGGVQDMAALILACAITVLVPRKLSSKMDLPLVILESLALSRPVVVSDQAPMCEALLGGGGLAVSFDDIGALTTAIQRLLSDNVLYHTLAGNGCEAVGRECNPETVIEQYRELYQSLSRKQV